MFEKRKIWDGCEECRFFDQQCEGTELTECDDRVVLIYHKKEEY